MGQAKFFSIFVFVALLGYGAVGFYLLPLATFKGDLTRMGLLPETLFGWTKPQPIIDPNLMQQASMQEADVLVIGDSFSAGRVWQTVLTKNGLKVRTESWLDVRAVCSDMVPWLRVQGFAGQYLVLESNERDLVNFLSASVSCPHMQYHPDIKAIAPRDPSTVSFDAKHGDNVGKLSTGFKVLRNELKYDHLQQAVDFKTWTPGKDVKTARIANGCELFSHARCEDALFLTWDRAEEVDGSALENVEKLNTHLNGVTPIWVFVPNKSTAYLFPDKQFWNNAEQRFHAPNLLRMTQRAIQNKTVDLYLANDTHFSTAGFLLMGEEIFKAMQQSQP